jgi:hypothetical protein
MPAISFSIRRLGTAGLRPSDNVTTPRGNELTICQTRGSGQSEHEFWHGIAYGVPRYSFSRSSFR